MFHELTPVRSARWIALYEHKISGGRDLEHQLVDQWGVELGKQLAKAILPELKKDGKVTTHDASTNA